MPGVDTNSKEMKREGDAKAAKAAAAVMHAHALAVRMTRAAKAASSALNETKVSGDADTKLRLSRMLRSIARQLLHHLRAQHATTGYEWGDAERSDHVEVVSSA